MGRGPQPRIHAGKSWVWRQAWMLVWASGDRLPWKASCSRSCGAEPPCSEKACTLGDTEGGRGAACPQPLPSKGTSPGTPCLRPWEAPFVWTHFPPDMTLLLLRAWLCSGGDTDWPQRPVTRGVHAGDPHSPAMMHFRGTQCGTPVGRSPRARGSLPAGSPERTCAPSLEFPPLH